MTKERYIRMVSRTRQVLLHLPGGEKLLQVPTYLCGAVYLVMLAWLAVNRDSRLVRAAAVPAISFVVVTILRPLINRQRPYDRFQVRPVGKWEQGKGKSFPSRHVVSAVAIACAVVYVFPTAAVASVMVLLGAIIAALRVVTGQHYPLDVMGAVALALLTAWLGFWI